MTRRQMIVSGVIAGLALLGVLGLLVVGRNQRLKSSIPAWLQLRQPPDTVAADMATVSEAESWAANRCRPMAASCGGNTAGRRIRREYPGSLEQSEHSFIRGHIELSGGV